MVSIFILSGFVTQNFPLKVQKSVKFCYYRSFLVCCCFQKSHFWHEFWLFSSKILFIITKLPVNSVQIVIFTLSLAYFWKITTKLSKIFKICQFLVLSLTQFSQVFQVKLVFSTLFGVIFHIIWCYFHLVLCFSLCLVFFTEFGGIFHILSENSQNLSKFWYYHSVLLVILC